MVKKSEKTSQTEGAGKRLLTVKEAALYLGLSEGTVRDWIFQRKIPKVKLGKSVRLSKDFLDQLIEKSTVRERTERGALSDSQE